MQKFQPSFLNLENKKDKKYTFLISDKLFYRFVINKSWIFCLIGEVKDAPLPTLFKDLPHTQTQSMFDYTTFRIIPELNHISFPNNYMEDKRFIQFIQLLIFFEFSEIEEQVLKPNQSKGTRREGKIKNESNLSVIVVDSLWNKFTRVCGEFMVSGHFRWQPCGKGNKDRELIYITEFTKEGYTRKATKEMNPENN